MEEIRGLDGCSIGLVYNVIRNYRDFMSKRLLINTLLLHYGCKLIAVTWLTSLFPCLYFKCDLLQTFPTIFQFPKEFIAYIV